ncbi:aldose 1-epimerase [Erythrobacter sp.]|uniref:aldose 1-epimerase n=1 Tax=Erythrobacter sp. TaxID=1042 RepID=UPI0025CDE5E4|nr:aldose 1-epimerase [Erythrobacter sp.]
MDLPHLILGHGDWRARILPQAGGLLTALDCGGVPVLRAMPAGSANPLDAACFPMVPWCNRIAGGKYAWAGERISLAPNFAPEPHAIHGHGWQSVWIVAEAEASRCTLVHRHDGTAPRWLWAYEARQAVVLDAAGCTITLSLTNLSPEPMPAGLGLHPYLRRRPESRVRFAAGSVVAVGADMIPTGEHLPPSQFGDYAAAGGAVLPPALIDHCYTGWDGAAVVEDDLGTITLRAAGAPHLHLYAPQAPDILCLEPVSHLPDAINAGGMPLCAPGETISLSLRIAAT